MSDHFTRLGLPRRFFVDPAALEREYLARSRSSHPDFHGHRSAAEQRASEAAAAALNEAYATLRDPARRAEYLLTLAGGPAARDDKALDPAFLMAMMDVRERVEAARETNSPDDLTAIEAELNQRRDGVLQAVAQQFDALDRHPSDGPAGPSALQAIRRKLNELKTVQSLLNGLSTE